MFVPDNPIIRDAERNGMPEPSVPICPVCEQECEDIYLDADGNVTGCDNCVRIKSAWVIRARFERRRTGRWKK